MMYDKWSLAVTGSFFYSAVIAVVAVVADGGAPDKHFPDKERAVRKYLTMCSGNDGHALDLKITLNCRVTTINIFITIHNDSAE